MCKFGGAPAICLQEKVSFVITKVPVITKTFDLDLDLEHILDAGPSGDHGVQVWLRSSHLSGRRSDLRKMFTDRQTDRRDGRTTDAARLH